MELSIADVIAGHKLGQDLPREVVWSCALLARDLNLRFDMGHVVAYTVKRRGVPTYTRMLTVDGWINWAGQFRDRDGNGLYAGFELEVLTTEEKAARLIPRA